MRHAFASHPTHPKDLDVGRNRTVQYGSVAVQARRGEAKRDQIRVAAGSLFLAHGFAGTSMDAVTAAAGVSKETLYHHYENKAALFADVLGQLISEPRTEVASRRRHAPKNAADLEALLVAATERYLTRVLEADQLALLRIVIAEGGRFPDLVEAFRSTLPATGGAVILKVLDDGRAARLVADWFDLRTAARAFAGILMMFIFREGLLVPKPRRPERRQIAEMVRIFVRGIRNEATGV